jgi:ATP-dependent DNA helicase RecG
MSSAHPISLDELVLQRTVEGARIVYMKGWNPDPIIKMLCAFAD